MPLILLYEVGGYYNTFLVPVASRVQNHILTDPNLVLLEHGITSIISAHDEVFVFLDKISLTHKERNNFAWFG